jgi:hypothetical protein
MDDEDHNIRNCTYAVRESEGRPHGAHDEQWRRAEPEHEETHTKAADSEDVLMIGSQR